MPQNPFGGKQPIGVIYNTSMSRPDAALALAELYGFEGKRESRMGSVCVVGAGLNAAIFCDLLFKFYFPQPRNGNQSLPVGLALVDPLPPDSPMVKAAVDRKNDKGEPQYLRTIRKPTDTSVAEAVLRNGVIFNAEAVMVLSAPATYLAKSLDLLGTKEVYNERVKRLVIVDTGAPQQDIPALRKVLAEWPGQVVLCGPEVGESLPFPGAAIDKDFSWAAAHPVADAYRAAKAMPYDTPSHDLAAAHYAVFPESEFFTLSDAGTISVDDSGRVHFAAGGSGKARKMVVDPAKREKLVQTFVEYASAKPVPPAQRFRPPSPAAAAPAKPAAPATKNP